jgi:thiamine-phosphate pyrophosphorylase
MGVTGLTRLQGLCLVVDPSLPHRTLLDIVEKSLKGGVDILQLWKPRKNSLKIRELARELLNLANDYSVPLIINNDIQLAKDVKADGVHFDGYEVTPSDARKALNEQNIVGYTVGNDLKWTKWAETMGANYVSFCSVFPSASAIQCEIIPLRTLRSAKSVTHIPVFASGGITLSNAHLVLETGVDGIAVISAIVKASDPRQAAESFKAIIHKYRPEA